MKKVFFRAVAAMAVVVVVFASASVTGECSTLWERKKGVGISKVSFSSAGTGMYDQNLISDANALYRDKTKKDLPEVSRQAALKDITDNINGAKIEYNYAATPDAIAYVVDTGLFVDQIDQLKSEGKLPSYYEYRPLDKYPKTGQAQLQKLIDSGVDLSPVFDPEWYFTHIVPAWTAPAEMYRDDFMKKLVSGVQGCATFDVDAYKEYNPDLYAVYGNDNHAYVVHYLTKGKDEGRVCVYPKEMYKGCFYGRFD